MTAFHLYCDAVVNLHKKVTLHCKITKHKIFMSQSRASVDGHAMHEDWMRTGVMTSGASLSEISSRFVFHVGKVLLWKV